MIFQQTNRCLQHPEGYAKHVYSDHPITYSHLCLEPDDYEMMFWWAENANTSWKTSNPSWNTSDDVFLALTWYSTGILHGAARCIWGGESRAIVMCSTESRITDRLTFGFQHVEPATHMVLSQDQTWKQATLDISYDFLCLWKYICRFI